MFYHLLVDGHLYLFLFLDSYAAVHIPVEVFVWTCIEGRSLALGKRRTETIEKVTHICEFPIQYLSKKQKKPMPLSPLFICRVMVFSTPKSVLKRQVAKKFIIPYTQNTI